MIHRLAFRTLTAHPVRSFVLALGFGAGVAVMAILLGVAEVVLEQAQSPALVGGGDVVIRLGRTTPPGVILSGALASDALKSRVQQAAPLTTERVFLVRGDGSTVRVDARGGIPSAELAMGDAETSGIEGWRDTPNDEAWLRAMPEAAQRQVDRFHEIPDAPAWADSWAEWLYFNGRSADARFYLTFLVGPRLPDGRRAAGVRLQLERDGRTESYSAGAAITQEEAMMAPDLTIGRNTVRLVGMQYQITLDLAGTGGRTVLGTLTLDATPGRVVPPIEITGARGWRTGYVVPVMSGRLGGSLRVGDEPGRSGGERGPEPAGARAGARSAGSSRAGSNRSSVEIALDGTGYHDHNWGFWRGVSWQWGQAQHEGLSIIYGRVFPPAEAVDPERMPGFVGVLGPDGPLGYATNVRITEVNDRDRRPKTIDVTARGPAMDVQLRFDVASAITTRMSQGPLGGAMTGSDGGRTTSRAPSRSAGINFLQLQGHYTVTGRAANRTLDFTTPGAAETFRGD